MKSNYIFYDFEKSRSRIDEILDAKDTSYEEVDKIPSRDKLTFTNGFYVNKTVAMFVDIRKSSELTEKYKRPTLAKIYRAFISEVVAIINGDDNCSEINIEGDCVWAIFNAQYKSEIDCIFSTSAQVASLIHILNCKFKKKDIEPISIGIGLDFGRALKIKAGYNGSTLNDVVYMGEVVNGASKLCGFANKTDNDYTIMVSSGFQSNLNEDHQKLLSYNSNRGCYHGYIINSSMNDWFEENCKDY